MNGEAREERHSKHSLSVRARSPVTTRELFMRRGGHSDGAHVASPFVYIFAFAILIVIGLIYSKRQRLMGVFE
jgi:hypothetical protein